MSSESIIVLTDVGGMRTVTYAWYIYIYITLLQVNVRWKILEFSRKINSTIQGPPPCSPRIYFSPVLPLPVIALGIALVIAQQKVYLSWHLIDLLPFSPPSSNRIELRYPARVYRKEKQQQSLYEKL